jgi:ABC-2 type transport system permease protein
MKPYLALLKARFAVLFQYRAAALAGVCTQIFWGLIKVMILQAFFAATNVSQPMTLEQAMTFVWLGQVILHLLPWNVDKEIEAQIKNGDVAYELIRPLDLYWIWFQRALAMRIVPTFLRAIPLVIIAGLFFNLGSPVSSDAFFGFLASIFFAAFLSASITTLVIISIFWTISGDGVVRLLAGVVIFLSGMLVPLPLFPEWMQPLLNMQPFRGVIDIPARIYTGIISTHEITYYLGFQLLWTAVFIVWGRYAICRAIKRFVIQGG